MGFLDSVCGVIKRELDLEKVVVEIEDEGVMLIDSGTVIPWNEISSCVEVGGETIVITHVGGLSFSIPKVNTVNNLCNSDLASSIRDGVSKLYATVTSIDDKDTIFEMLGMLERSYELYATLSQGAQFICLHEPQALSALRKFLIGLLVACSASGEPDPFTLFARLGLFDEEEVKERFLALDRFADDYKSTIVNDGYETQILIESAQDYARIKYLIHFEFELMGDRQYNDANYRYMRDSTEKDELPNESEWVKWLDEEFASPDFARRRKVIVISDETTALNDQDTDEIAVLRTADVAKLISRQRGDDPLDTVLGQREAARKRGSDMTMPEAKNSALLYAKARHDRQLFFDGGLPKNGTVYLQHPLSSNVYIDIRSFHVGVLEHKYQELIRILTDLGAKEIICSIESSGSTELRQKLQNSSTADFGSSGLGGVNYSENSEDEGRQILALYKRLDTHLELNPQGARRVPEDVVFYPYEESWKQLAKEVVSGRLLKASFDLTYRRDYSITSSYVNKVGIKIDSMFPGWNFSSNGNDEERFESELKELESTTWHYEVDFDSQVESESEPQPKEEKPTVQAVAEASASAIENDEAEAVIRSRAKRYAKTEEAAKSGVLSDAQMADLERLASKYGVSDLRLDKLINEAFV